MTLLGEDVLTTDDDDDVLEELFTSFLMKPKPGNNGPIALMLP